MRQSRHPRQRYLPRFDPVAPFTRWLGRALSRHEQEVISALEARRFHDFPSPRVLVLDPWNESSIPVLSQYLRYLDKVNPSLRLRSFVIDRTRSEAKAFATGYRKDCLYASYLTARRSRGHNYQRLLLFNVQDYAHSSPLRDDPSRWQRLYRTVIGPITLDRNNLVIVHSQLPRYWVKEQATRVRLSYALPDIMKSSLAIDTETRDFQRKIKELNRSRNTPIITQVNTRTKSPPSPRNSCEATNPSNHEVILGTKYHILPVSAILPARDILPGKPTGLPGQR